jgi:hypothetical protein
VSVNLVSFADESGTHDASGVQLGADAAGMFGYIASKDQWDALTRAWSAVLKEYGVDFFHASDFADRINGPKKPNWPYQGWDDARRNSFIRRLIAIARDGTRFSVGGIVDVKAYDKLTPAWMKEDMQHPYQFCFQLFLDQVRGIVDEMLEPPLDPSDKVDFFFDQQNEWEIRARQTFSTVKQLRDVRNRLGVLSFVDKKEFPPLQAADLLAYVMRQSASHRLNGDFSIKQGGWEDQLIERRNAMIGYYNETDLQRFFNEAAANDSLTQGGAS